MAVKQSEMINVRDFASKVGGELGRPIPKGALKLVHLTRKETTVALLVNQHNQIARDQLRSVVRGTSLAQYVAG